MKQFLIEEQVLQALYEYLMKKPMLEVEPLVNTIRQLKPIEEKIDNG